MLIDHGGAWRAAEVGEAHSFMERIVLVFVEFNTPFSKFSNRTSDTTEDNNPRKNFPGVQNQFSAIDKVFSQLNLLGVCFELALLNPAFV